MFYHIVYVEKNTENKRKKLGQVISIQTFRYIT